MIKNLFSRLFPPPAADLDISALWQRFHPHLLPYAESLATVDEIPLFANLRFAGSNWLDMVEIVFRTADQRFILPIASQQTLLAANSGLDFSQLDAIDARLWSAEPTMINIEPTTRCNFNCWYCVGRHMQQADIRLEDFARMLDNFPTVRTIALVGEGEPLLHKDFFTMAQMAKARGIRVMIISNGSAFSQSVIRQLCEAEVAYVSISIDSANPQTFANSRLDGNLEKIWQGIRNLRAYRDANNYQLPKIALKGTLFDATRDEMPSIVAAAQAHGVEIFESFQALNPMQNYVRIYPREQLPELTTVDAVQASINRDSALARDKLQPFESFCNEQEIDFFPPVRANPRRKNCNETWLYSLLSGDITPCCQIKTPPSPNWNIFQRPADAILHDPDYENMRFNLWNGIFPTYCAGCWKTR